MENTKKVFKVNERFEINYDFMLCPKNLEDLKSIGDYNFVLKTSPKWDSLWNDKDKEDADFLVYGIVDGWYCKFNNCTLFVNVQEDGVKVVEWVQ